MATDMTPEAIAALADHVTPKPVVLELGDEADHKVLVVPNGDNGFRVLSPDAIVARSAPFPRRRSGISKHSTIGSLIAHIKRNGTFGDPALPIGETVVFADDGAVGKRTPSLTAIYNYHSSGLDSGDYDAARSIRATAGWLDHRAIFEARLSREWLAWSTVAARLDQGAFAAFLEERILDVVDPASVGERAKEVATALGASFAAPARLMELARGLSIRENVQVRQAVNLATGEGEIAFAAEHTDDVGAKIKIPSAFVIAIPVFAGDSALYQIPVRLRYRLSGGRVTWTLELHGIERVLEHAFAELVASVEKGTGAPIYFGEAEQPIADRHLEIAVGA